MGESLKELFGDFVFNKEGQKVSVESLAGMPVAIYFSAHWCPPCRGFTPVLAAFYTKYKEQGKKFEIVFVTSDRDQAAHDGYFSDMPWLTVGFGSDKSDFLKQKFNVRGIPYLVVVDAEGKTISTDGRSQVMGEADTGTFPWE